MDFFSTYVILVNIVCVIIIVYVYSIIRRYEKPYLGDLVVLFLFIRTLLELPVYRYNVFVLQDYIILFGLVFFYALYRRGYRDNNPVTWFFTLSLWMFPWGWVWFRMKYVPNDTYASILFYLIASTTYILWWKEDIGRLGLKYMYAISYITDMRELIHTYQLHFAHWLFHVKPLLWLYILLILGRRELVLSPVRMVVIMVFTLFANIVEYMCINHILVIGLGPLISPLLIRLVILPAPLAIVKRR